MDELVGPVIGTLFDSDKTDPHPDFSRITIADFDFYIHILYTYVSFYFYCDLNVNRVEKRFRLTIPKYEGDLFIKHSFNPVSGNLCQIEYFQIAMNAQWILYSFDTIKKVKQMFSDFEREYKVNGINSNPGYALMRNNLTSAISELMFQNSNYQYNDEITELTRISNFIRNSNRLERIENIIESI